MSSKAAIKLDEAAHAAALKIQADEAAAVAADINGRFVDANGNPVSPAGDHAATVAAQRAAKEAAKPPVKIKATGYLPTLTKVHPAAEVFPLLNGEDLIALAEDIRAYGLRNPVTVDAYGVLLDGRNRLTACATIGAPSSYVIYAGEDQVEFIASSNLARRQLTNAQKAAVAEALVPFFAAQIKAKTDAEKSAKTSVGMVAKWKSRSAVSDTVDLPAGDKNHPDVERGRTLRGPTAAQQAAKAAGASEQATKRVMAVSKVAEVGEALVAEIAAGTSTIAAAERKAGIETRAERKASVIEAQVALGRDRDDTNALQVSVTGEQDKAIAKIVGAYNALHVMSWTGVNIGHIKSLRDVNAALDKLITKLEAKLAANTTAYHHRVVRGGQLLARPSG